MGKIGITNQNLKEAVYRVVPLFWEIWEIVEIKKNVFLSKTKETVEVRRIFLLDVETLNVKNLQNCFVSMTENTV